MAGFSYRRTAVLCAGFLLLVAILSQARRPATSHRPSPRHDRSMADSPEVWIPVACATSVEDEEGSYAELPAEYSFLRETGAPPHSLHPGRQVSEQTALLVLEVSPRRVRLKKCVAKEFPQFEARRTDWTARYRIRDAHGNVLHQGGFDLPALCEGDCPTSAVDHEKGDVVIPHAVELCVKVPHFEQAKDLWVYRIDRNGFQIDLGVVGLK